MASEIDGLRPDGKRKAGGSSSSSPKKTFRLWTSFLLGGQTAYRYEASSSGPTAEVLPDFDLEANGYRWGVLWPERRIRSNGALLVVEPVKRVGGKVRIEDEDGSIHYAKSLARAKEKALEAMDAGRPT